MVFQNSFSPWIWKTKYHLSGSFWLWDYQSGIGAGYNPQISTGSTMAKYIWTSGSASPYTVNIGTESLSKPSAAIAQQAYSREVSLIDTTNQASLTVELRPPEVRHSDGTVTAILLSANSLDNTLVSAERLASVLETQKFRISNSLDKFDITVKVRGKNIERLLWMDSTTISVVLVESQSGKLVKTILQIPCSGIEDLQEKSTSVSIAFNELSSYQLSSDLNLQCVLSGLKESRDLVISVGHLYKPCERSVAQPEYSDPLSASIEGLPLLFTYPNPFNPSTTFRIRLPEASRASLIVYSTLGQELARVVDGELSAGEHEFTFNAQNLATGLYLYRFNVNSKVYTGKLMLIR
jgi:hypothetical protein